MAEPRIGDRISIDTKKVGQPRRGGVVRGVTQGLAGARFEIEWDDGSRTIIAPRAGVLLVEGKAAKKSSKAPSKAKASGKKARPARSSKNGKRRR